MSMQNVSALEGPVIMQSEQTAVALENNSTTQKVKKVVGGALFFSTAGILMFANLYVTSSFMGDLIMGGGYSHNPTTEYVVKPAVGSPIVLVIMGLFWLSLWGCKKCNDRYGQSATDGPVEEELENNLRV